MAAFRTGGVCYETLWCESLTVPLIVDGDKDRHSEVDSASNLAVGCRERLPGKRRGVYITHASSIPGLRGRDVGIILLTSLQPSLEVVDDSKDSLPQGEDRLVQVARTFPDKRQLAEELPLPVLRLDLTRLLTVGKDSQAS